MRKILLLTLLSVSKIITAQPFTVEGQVVDAETKEGLANALVFVNQSLKSVRTDSTGKYTIENISDKNFEVVVWLKGYETLPYFATAAKQKTAIKFELQKASDTVNAYSQNDYDKWGFLFLYNLLGGSKNAAECELDNPEALRFKYDDKGSVLSVFSVEPLRIINDGLGYLITYQLDSFLVSPVGKGRISHGYCYFKKLTTKRDEIANKWKQRREEAFAGSINHFFKSVYTHTLDQEGFEIHNVERVFADEPEYAKVKDTKRYTVFNKGSSLDKGIRKNFAYVVEKKAAVLDSLFSVNPNINNYSFNCPGILQVTYKNENEDLPYLLQVPGTTALGNQRSFLQCRNPLLLQPTGMYFQAEDLFATGYMEWEKLADLLPFDYTDQQ